MCGDAVILASAVHDPTYRSSMFIAQLHYWYGYCAATVTITTTEIAVFIIIAVVGAILIFIYLMVRSCFFLVVLPFYFCVSFVFGCFKTRIS